MLNGNYAACLLKNAFDCTQHALILHNKSKGINATIMNNIQDILDNQAIRAIAFAVFNTPRCQELAPDLYEEAHRTIMKCEKEINKLKENGRSDRHRSVVSRDSIPT